MPANMMLLACTFIATSGFIDIPNLEPAFLKILSVCSELGRPGIPFAPEEIVHSWYA
jgi:hypothetical protein